VRESVAVDLDFNQATRVARTIAADIAFACP
jgi:hypothetical protein